MPTFLDITTVVEYNESVFQMSPGTNVMWSLCCFHMMETSKLMRQRWHFHSILIEFEAGGG